MTNMLSEIEVFSGDTLVLAVTTKNDRTGNTWSLIDSDISWVLARSASDTPILTKEIGSGITVTDAQYGEFEVKVDPVDTEALDGRFVHEAQVTDQDGDVSTIFSGTLHIIEDTA